MASPGFKDVTLINDHARRHYNGVLECRWTPGKGRVVHATRAFARGEFILEEAPLHVVQEEAESAAFRKLKNLCAEFGDDFDFEPLWYWCALRSLTEAQLRGAACGGWPALGAQQQQSLLLLHREAESMESKPGSSARILARELAPAAEPSDIEALTQAWVLNCFDYSDDPQGYCTYFFSSFMSHSCLPNAFWYYAGDNHALRARTDIAAGDEVCISYLNEDWLLRSGPERRWDLHETKRFWCACERCAGHEDASRGFACPRCCAGTVFAPAPGAGPARRRAPPPGDLRGAPCAACGHRLTEREAALLLRRERALADLVEALEVAEATVGAEAARGLRELTEEGFAQHWLADRAWELLAGRPHGGDRLQMLKRRCSFCFRAYPGTSGAHAWALEAYADAWESAAGTPSPAQRRELQDVGAAYKEAHRILRLLYGAEHEYVVELEKKASPVWSFERGREGSAGRTPSRKRRRLLGKQPQPLPA